MTDKPTRSDHIRRQRSEQEVLNKQHFDHPQPGDRWVERIHPYFEVAEVTPSGDIVVINVVYNDIGEGHWDTENPETLSRERWAQLLKYPSIDGFIADVYPGPSTVGLASRHFTVPFQPTEAQWSGLARDIVMWLQFAETTGATLHQHLRRLGRNIPGWLAEEIHDINAVPPKGTIVTVIYKAMLMDYTEPEEKSEDA